MKSIDTNLMKNSLLPSSSFKNKDLSTLKSFGSPLKSKKPSDPHFSNISIHSGRKVSFEKSNGFDIQLYKADMQLESPKSPLLQHDQTGTPPQSVRKSSYQPNMTTPSKKSRCQFVDPYSFSSTQQKHLTPLSASSGSECHNCHRFREDFQVESMIGSGNYGQVFKA